MQSIIRLSLFGNYEKFSTSNLDNYMKLIEFFTKRCYRPATTNELQLQQNGQARVLVMPVFLNDTGAVVEITSNRISFQKEFSDVMMIEVLSKEFVNEFFDWLDMFIVDMSISSNRVALNCEIYKDEITTEMPTQSSYFNNANKTEMTVRNVARKEVGKEESNIIIEKYVNVDGGFTRYLYDINSNGENKLLRFSSENIHKMYKAYINIATEIEKGLQ